LDSLSPKQGRMAVVYKRDDEPSDSIKARAFLMWADINFQNGASAICLAKAYAVLQLFVWLFRCTVQ
jgi:hypothetical protein